MVLSYSEENYLKAIFNLRENKSDKITTNAIAFAVDATPASVTDMIQKLHEKKLVNYERYQGVSLTTSGAKSAVSVIRKHRLWELFLVSKLGFHWDEVHDIAEQLEHIQSESLVQKLYNFLGKPKSDPHGDPIPDEKGNFHLLKTMRLSECVEEEKYELSGVTDHSPGFLKHLDQLGLILGKKIVVKKITDYDKSMTIMLPGVKPLKYISGEVAKNLLVTITK
jgi:DtxR family Mn-dependent transcriptional regulator